MQQIADWLKTVNISQYARHFAVSDIDTSVGYCEILGLDVRFILKASHLFWNAATKTTRKQNKNLVTFANITDFRTCCATSSMIGLRGACLMLLLVTAGRSELANLS
jgi:hypothetical protein